MKQFLSLFLPGILLFGLITGCGNMNSDTESVSDPVIIESTETFATSRSTEAHEEADLSQADADMFTDRDYEADYDESSSVLIQLNESSATASSDSVKISGSTITITEEATYIISGTLDDGMIIVNTDDTAKLQLVFNGVDINSETSAALYILEADKVFITLADGTENTLSNGGAFTAIDENNIDATLFTKQDLTFNGSGSLIVTSPAGHGIVCKDDLVFMGGSYTVTSASHGLDANDSVRVAGATVLTIDAGKDGIHCENTEDASLGFVYISNGTINIEAEGDGIAAGAYMQIDGGTFDLLIGGGSENGSSASSDSYGGFMGGGRHGQAFQATTTTDDSITSMKGLKAGGSILINGGTFTVDSADDAIHSDVSITINGGTFEIESGDDAIHAEDMLTVTDCTMNVAESYEGLEAQTIYVEGGDIVVYASDDGLNASGGNDSSGTTGGRDGMFGGGGMASSANGHIEISGGNLTVYSSGDGLDSNGTITISGGYIYVANPSSGDTSVMDANSRPVITGGTFVSTGASSMMAQSFASSSTQGVIACTTDSQKAGSTVTVKDSEGDTVISYDVEYSCVLVIISSPDIVKGETYTLTIGSTSGSLEAN